MTTRLVVLLVVFLGSTFAQALSNFTADESKVIRSVVQSSSDLKKELGDVSKYTIEAVRYSVFPVDFYKDPLGCEHDKCALVDLYKDEGDVRIVNTLQVVVNLTKKTIRVNKFRPI